MPGCPLTGRTQPDNYIPAFASFNFTPDDASWNVRWRRGGAYGLAWSDVEFYTVDLRLQNPADKNYVFNLQVMAGGVKIGIIYVTIPQGQIAAQVTYSNNAGAKVTPAGSPPSISDRFWLACTTNHGKLRGNADKVNARGANVLLRIGSDHRRTSSSHNIICV